MTAAGMGREAMRQSIARNGSIASLMWEMVDRACYCPIVYDALEAFKEELGFKL